LRENKIAGGSEIDQVNKRVSKILDEDLAWAESQPTPAPEDAVGGVYADDSKPKAISVGRED